MALKGKRALITGGAVRLGEAVCTALAREGVNLVIHYNHSKDKALSLRSTFREQGISCEIARMDFAEPEGCEDFFKRLTAEAGPIDILVNSASPYGVDSIWTLSAENSLKSYAAGAVSPLLLSRAFHAQGRPGCIINILDARMDDYDRNHVTYSLAKRALRDITRLTSAEFAPLVRVNAVAPGFIVFTGLKEAENERAIIQAGLLENLPTLNDVVSCILFLIEAETITGQVLYPDSGRNFKGNVYG